MANFKPELPDLDPEIYLNFHIFPGTSGQRKPATLVINSLALLTLFVSYFRSPCLQAKAQICWLSHSRLVLRKTESGQALGPSAFGPHAEIDHADNRAKQERAHAQLPGSGRLDLQLLMDSEEQVKANAGNQRHHGADQERFP
jgi:hypothetical protein